VARSDARHETGAVLLLSWLIRPEQNVEFTVPSGYLPVTRPALQSQLLQDSLANLDVAGAKGNSLCLHTFLDQMSYSRLYFPVAFRGSYAVRQQLENSLAEIAYDSHLSWLQDQKNGAIPPATLESYTNEAVFEKWYSQLINDTGRLLN